MNKNILLIDPPWYRMFGSAFTGYPIGLCYLAAVLEKHGFNASVYNADYRYEKLGESTFGDARELTKAYDKYLHVLQDTSHPLWKEIETVLSRYSPDIVGISVMTSKYNSALAVSRLVKNLSSDIKVVWGGVHPTILPEESIRNKYVDIVVRGEGENTFLELVQSLKSGKPLGSIAGITYKENGEIINNQNRPLIQNLDELPFPARYLLLERETYPRESFGRIFSTRGCPYHCTFCASHKVWTRKVRYRSPRNIVDEIKHTQKTFGVNYFQFEDDSFTVNKQFVTEICDLMIKEKLKTNWLCETRADIMTDELARKMRAAGCTKISIGAESGDEETLKKIKKGVSLTQLRDAARILNKNGIRLSAFFMIGFPWDTEETIRRTISFMKELDPDTANYSIVTPYPGTELYDFAIAEGIIPPNMDWSAYFHQSPDMFLNKNISRDEVSRLIESTEETFKQHNTRKRRQLLTKHPLYALKLVYRSGYFKPRLLRSLLRSSFNR